MKQNNFNLFVLETDCNPKLIMRVKLLVLIFQSLHPETLFHQVIILSQLRNVFLLLISSQRSQ